AFALLPVLGILAVVTTPLLRGQAVTRLLALVLTGAVLAAPFAMNLASGGTMPPRTLVAAPAALWFTVLLGLEFGSPWLRRATVLATLAASAQALYVFALFQAADAVAKQRDEQLAAAIYARIAEVRPDLAYGDPIKLDVFGGQPLRSPYPRVKDSTVGASVFEWDGGNPYRIASLYRVLGYSGIVPVDDEQRRRLLPVFASMPVWPAKGSVRAEGDATLVKLGNTPGNVHDVLLHNAPRMAPVSFPPEPPPGGG
ncbi:MAG: hypothetical protein JOZ05_23305, partial [Acetobacteraceae bacterium]|nr:hypothetical protein [Acetobacteraceae bacterium]